MERCLNTPPAWGADDLPVDFVVFVDDGTLTGAAGRTARDRRGVFGLVELNRVGFDWDIVVIARRDIHLGHGGTAVENKGRSMRPANQSNQLNIGDAGSEHKDAGDGELACQTSQL
jgi:hypothetical protein